MPRRSAGGAEGGSDSGNAGAGLARPPRLTPAQLNRLLTDESLAQRAKEIRAEIASMPPASELVDPLVHETA
ncbi:MAG TPA: hypothetical protein VK059_04210 [Nocardioidaceae bacterium]|nr:hypothetical protein [Nocardioidaceae bacterium]